MPVYTFPDLHRRAGDRPSLPHLDTVARGQFLSRGPHGGRMGGEQFRPPNGADASVAPTAVRGSQNLQMRAPEAVFGVMYQGDVLPRFFFLKSKGGAWLEIRGAP
jgi:hypothetical protein